MEQIIGKESKPLRFNLSAVYKRGSDQVPAEGEPVLISIDNDITTNGSGTFDAYVIGDGVSTVKLLPIQFGQTKQKTCTLFNTSVIPYNDTYAVSRSQVEQAIVDMWIEIKNENDLEYLPFSPVTIGLTDGYIDSTFWVVDASGNYVLSAGTWNNIHIEANQKQRYAYWSGEFSKTGYSIKATVHCIIDTWFNKSYQSGIKFNLLRNDLCNEHPGAVYDYLHNDNKPFQNLRNSFNYFSLNSIGVFWGYERSTYFLNSIGELINGGGDPAFFNIGYSDIRQFDMLICRTSWQLSKPWRTYWSNAWFYDINLTPIGNGHIVEGSCILTKPANAAYFRMSGNESISVRAYRNNTQIDAIDDFSIRQNVQPYCITFKRNTYSLPGSASYNMLETELDLTQIHDKLRLSVFDRLILLCVISDSDHNVELYTQFKNQHGGFFYRLTKQLFLDYDDKYVVQIDCKLPLLGTYGELADYTNIENTFEGIGIGRIGDPPTEPWTCQVIYGCLLTHIVDAPYVENINMSELTLLPNFYSDEFSYISASSAVHSISPCINNFRAYIPLNVHTSSDSATVWENFDITLVDHSKTIRLEFEVGYIGTPRQENGSFGVWIAEGTGYVSGKLSKLGEYFPGKYTLEIDLAYYSVYGGFQTNYIWLVTPRNSPMYRIISMTTVEEPSNETFGKTIKDLPANLNAALDDIKTLIGGEMYASALGESYKIRINAQGQVVTIPMYPSKGFFFGNSLLRGFGSYGMAASDSQYDFCSLISRYIVEHVNPNFTYFRNTDSNIYPERPEGKTMQQILDLYVNILDSDVDLIVMELSDNAQDLEGWWNEMAERLMQASMTKAPRCRFIWLCAWYFTSAKRQLIQRLSAKYKCEFVDISTLRYIDDSGSNGSSAMGAVYHARTTPAAVTYRNVKNIVDNGNNTITVTLTLEDGNDYTTDAWPCTTWSNSGTDLYITTEYSIITSTGVASHPGDDGFRRITNKFLYECGFSDTEETYTKLDLGIITRSIYR